MSMLTWARETQASYVVAKQVHEDTFAWKVYQQVTKAWKVQSDTKKEGLSH